MIKIEMYVIRHEFEDMYTMIYNDVADVDRVTLYSTFVKGLDLYTEDELLEECYKDLRTRKNEEIKYSD